MKKGTKVSWKLKDGSSGGSGTVTTDEVDGHVHVAVESEWGQGMEWNHEMHRVIYCAVTWLTTA